MHGNARDGLLLPGLRLFHAVAWVAVTAGPLLLWRRVTLGAAVAWRRPALVGLLIAGWGLFNVVEGTVDHHVLGIHHVRPGPDQLAWDLGFLGFGVLLLVAGLVIYRGARVGTSRSRAHRRHPGHPFLIT